MTTNRALTTVEAKRRLNKQTLKIQGQGERAHHIQMNRTGAGQNWIVKHLKAKTNRGVGGKPRSGVWHAPRAPRG